MTALEILKNRGEAWEYMNTLEVTPVVDALAAMKKVADLVFDAGEKYGRDQEFVIDKTKGQVYPNKEQLLKELFKDTSV